MSLRKIIHGEVVVLEVKKIPTGAKKINITEKYFVVGESETVGNDHRISVSNGTNLYSCDGKLYVENLSDEKIYCSASKRHSESVIPGGCIWDFGIAQEYDYVKMEKRNVAD